MISASSVESAVIKPKPDGKREVRATRQVTTLTCEGRAGHRPLLLSGLQNGFPIGITNVRNGLASSLSSSFLLMSPPEFFPFTKYIEFYSIPTNASPGRQRLGVPGCPLLLHRLHCWRGGRWSESPFRRGPVKNLPVVTEGKQSLVLPDQDKRIRCNFLRRHNQA